MGLSKVDIYNNALLKVSKKLVSTTDDGSFEEKICSQLFPQALQRTLGCHNWSSTIRRAELNRIIGTPSFGYQYQYQLPNDCVKVVRAYKSTLKDDFDFYWVTEGRLLLSDTEVVYIKYVREPQNTDQLNTHITDVLIWNLALGLCYPFTGDDNRERALRQEFETVILPRAKANDAMESREVEFEESPWIESLYGGSPSLGRD